MPSEKKNRLAVFLIKDGIKSHSDILEGYDSLNMREIKDVNNKLIGNFYFPRSNEYPPDWLEDFFGRIDLEVVFKNSNTRGVYIVQAANRFFALGFGHGKSMLIKSSIEEDFGLYTTLNLVLPDTLKSIDKIDLALSGKKSKEHLVKSGNISDFGIDVEQDLVSEVTGKSKVERLGNIITGKDCFHTKVGANSINIATFLEDFLFYRKKDDYKIDFDWIDNVKGVTDKLLISKLNQKLIDKIKLDDNEKIWLAVPDVIVWSDIEGFKYGKSSPRSEIYDDLNVQEFKSLFSEAINELEIDDLQKKLHAFCGYDFAGKEFKKWSIFECLYCEIDLSGESYILSNGRWYKVQTDFVTQIKEKFAAIGNVDLGLQGFSESKYKGKGKDKGETGYNKEIAGTNNDYILFDTKNINIGGGKNKVEFCDLYQKSKKRLIHIKRYGGSNVFSHLFNQGLVSGELFLSERKFREKVNNLLSDDSKIQNLEQKPNANEYNIVFGIISHSESDLELPFFSKVSLSNVYRRLQNMGFNVYKAKIEKID